MGMINKVFYDSAKIVESINEIKEMDLTKMDPLKQAFYKKTLASLELTKCINDNYEKAYKALQLLETGKSLGQIDNQKELALLKAFRECGIRIEKANELLQQIDV